MGAALTAFEMEWARAYIIWKSIKKALKKDSDIFQTTEFNLTIVYRHFLTQAMHLVDNELAKLSNRVIRVNRTGQPTVWEVRVGSHHGYIEVNVVEMVLEFEKLLQGSHNMSV